VHTLQSFHLQPFALAFRGVGNVFTSSRPSCETGFQRERPKPTGPRRSDPLQVQSTLLCRRVGLCRVPSLREIGRIMIPQKYLHPHTFPTILPRVSSRGSLLPRISLKPNMMAEGRLHMRPQTHNMKLRRMEVAANLSGSSTR
jgi:hypothetical protein